MLPRKQYFALLRLHTPGRWARRVAAYREANKELIRNQTRLRVRRFRARKG